MIKVLQRNRQIFVVAALAVLSVIAYVTQTLAFSGFGMEFANPGMYDYVPSYIVDGTVHQFWWCSGPEQGDDPSMPPGDVIKYREVDTATGIGSTIRTVLRPGMGTWDKAHTCDPSVVKGVFSYAGNTYTYAMYYTATDDPTNGGINNGIGVAFSNDRVTWVKYPYPILRSVTSASTYGYGQQSVLSANGASELWLWATQLLPGAPQTWVLYHSPDGLHLDVQLTVSTSGIQGGAILEADFAYDYNTGLLYMVSDRGDVHSTIDLYSIPWASQGSGTWTYITSITPALTGQQTNHGAGIRHDPYGAVTPFLPQIVAVFASTASMYDDKLSWELYWAVNP